MTPRKTRSTKIRPPDALATELEGYVKLGIHKAAIRLAKRLLHKPTITCLQFHQAISAVIEFETHLKQWRKPVEDAYARLSIKNRRRQRFSMLWFLHGMGDEVAASQFLPKRFNTPFSLVELGLAWEIWLALDNEKALDANLGKVVRAASFAENSYMCGALYANLGHFFVRRERWQEAADSYRQIPLESANSHAAVIGPLAASVGQLVSEIDASRTVLNQFKRCHDPEGEAVPSENQSGEFCDLERKLNCLHRELWNFIQTKWLKELDMPIVLRLKLEALGEAIATS